MNIKEYKDRKDKLRQDIEMLVREFNRDAETIILSLDIDINISRGVGEENPVMFGFNCAITTEIDR